MRRVFIAILILIINFPQFSSEPKKVLDLRGEWKFSIGDNPEWSKLNYRDQNWETIKVPSSWENEGFHGYNGYAWYRREFNGNSAWSGSTLILNLGMIDDADEVFINGIKIGSTGSFPPNYQTAYNIHRRYTIPISILNLSGKNVIAVRVYDNELEGGMINGEQAIYSVRSELVLAQYLEGVWKFKTGDSPLYNENDFNDRSWEDIIVPGYWDAQGYSKYDGYAWYRLNFTPATNLLNQKLVLVLGRIDDFDQTFLNGVLIGSTGNFNNPSIGFVHSNEYRAFRGYYIPQGVLKEGENIISVRVFDAFQDGGIYNGPIGLITQDNYVNFFSKKK